MEAVPRLPMLQFSRKEVDSPTEFGNVIKKLIRAHYQEDPDAFRREISDLESMRSAAVHASVDVTGCATLKKYFCQLHFLLSRFPVYDGNLDLIFHWKDIYSSAVYSVSNLRYEMAAILYNIGALHTMLGAGDTRTTPEGMKMSCTHFQCAAWAFQHLKENFTQSSDSDLSPSLLFVKYQICFAQAQECILEKSMADNRKPNIIGKVAMQVVEFLKSALKVLDHGTKSEDTPICEIIGSKKCKAWKRYCEFKIAYYESVKYLYLGMHSEEQQKMGERCAYYKASSEKLNEAMKLQKNLDVQEAVMESLSFTNDVVVGKLTISQKENDFVYHEKVPDVASLPEVKGASLVKGISFDVNDVEVSGHDIFGRLIPLEAHQASSMYSEEKAKLLRKMTALVENKNGELDSLLLSLQIETLLLSESEDMPQELVECCAELHSTNGVNVLIDTISKITQHSSDIKSTLDEISVMLEKEEASAKEFSIIMGKQPPSLIAADLKRELAKYAEAHKDAQENNKSLSAALEKHLPALHALSESVEAVSRSLPSVLDAERDEGKEVKHEYQRLLCKVDEMKTQRIKLETQLRENIQADDITKQVITCQDDIRSLFKKELKKHDKVVSILEQNLAAQSNILKALTEVNASYAPTRRLTNQLHVQRTEKINSYLASYNAYVNMGKKTKDAFDFYKKLESQVYKLLSKTKSVCQVQAEEREGKMRVNMKTALFSSQIPSDLTHTSSTSGPKLKDYLHNVAHAGRYAVNKSSHIPSSTLSNTRPPPLGSEQVEGVSHFHNAYAPSAPSLIPSPSSVNNSPHRSFPSSALITQGDSISSFACPKDTTYGGFKNQQDQGSGAYAPYSAAQVSTPHPALPLTPGVPFASYNSGTKVYPSDHNFTTRSAYNYQHPPFSASVPGQVNTHSGTQASDISVYPTGQGVGLTSVTICSAFGINSNSVPVCSYHMPSGAISNEVFAQCTSVHNSHALQPSVHYSTGSTFPTASNTISPIHSHSTSYPVQHPLPVDPVPVKNAISVTTSVSTTAGYQATQVSNAAHIPVANSTVPCFSGPSLIAPYSQQVHGPSIPYPSDQHLSNMYTSSSSHISSYGIGKAHSPCTSLCSGSYLSSTHAYSSAGSTNSQAIPIMSHVGIAAPGLVSLSVTGLPVSSSCVNAISKISSAGSITSSEHYSGIPVSQQHYSAHPGLNYTADQFPQASTTISASQVKQDPANSGSVGSQIKSKVSNKDLLSGIDLHAPPGQWSPLKPLNLNASKKFASSDGLAASSGKSGSQSSSLNSKENEKSKLPSEELKALDVATKEGSSSTASLVMHGIDLSMYSKNNKRKQSYTDPLTSSEVLDKLASETERLTKFVEGLSKKSLNGPTNLELKWKELTEVLEKSNDLKVSVARCYPLKNRFPDILPFDHSRVPLSSQRDDYVNASFVRTSSEKAVPMILTQAPLTSTFSDFWCMVWEQQVELICCMCLEAEVKGQIYWPAEEGSSVNYGSISVLYHSCQESSGKQFSRRIFHLTYQKMKLTRVVLQLQFLSWPPGEIPENPSALLHFLNEMHLLHSQQRNKLKSVVVHCVPGIGRSGVVAVLSSFIKEIVTEGQMLDLWSLIVCVSEQRRNAIHDSQHLYLIYRAALYYVQDILLNRGILTNKASFEDGPRERTHVRHPSADLLSSMDFPKMKVKLGLDDSSSTASNCSASGNADNKDEQTEELLESSRDSIIHDVPAEPMSSCFSHLPPNLASTLAPENFKVDPPDLHRLPKITKESFKSNLSQLEKKMVDSSDPLSSLDPLWSLKK